MANVRLNKEELEQRSAKIMDNMKQIIKTCIIDGSDLGTAYAEDDLAIVISASLTGVIESLSNLSPTLFDKVRRLTVRELFTIGIHYDRKD